MTDTSKILNEWKNIGYSCESVIYMENLDHFRHTEQKLREFIDAHIALGKEDGVIAHLMMRRDLYRPEYAHYLCDVCCLNVTSNTMGSNHHTGAFKCKYLLQHI